MNRIRAATANVTVFAIATAVAASCATAPATAAPSPYCDTTSWTYDRDLCAQSGAGSGPTSVPTTTAPSSGGSSGETLYAGHPLSHYAVLAVIVVLGIAAVAKLAGWAAASTAAQQEQAAQREQVALTRGRRIAEDWHAGEVQRIRAQMPQPDPHEYDPLGLGLAAPRVADPKVPHPPMDAPDLKRYAKFGRVVPWQANTAIAAVMNQDGSDEKARDAWLESCTAANAGEADEAGNFTPCASYRGLELPLDAAETGDVLLRVMPAGLHVGEREMNAAGAYLARCAMVTIAHPFVRHAHTGEYWARLSMHAAPQQPQAAPAPQSAPVAGPLDDDEDW